MTEIRQPSPGHTAGRQLAQLTAGTLSVAVLALAGLSVAWGWRPTSAFLAGVAVGLFAVVIVIRRSLTRARAMDGPERITTATWVTIARSGLVAAFAGFLFTEPSGGSVALLPAGLFGGAALLDAVDGAIARRTDSVTEFGGALDVEVDALLVAAGGVAAVVTGSVPPVFLAVVMARYAFSVGVWLRRRRGLPVVELDPSRFRQATGTVIMSTVFLALLPTPGPTVSRTIAWTVFAPVSVHFLWDWATVSGRLDR